MTKLDTFTRSEICRWIQAFRNSLADELGETEAANEIFSVPSFWTQHLLISDPTALAKGRRYYEAPGTFIDIPTYHAESGAAE